MVELLIIADDFTGALDTSVQFVKYGAKSLVQTTLSLEGIVQSDIAVLVIDTESRHVSRGEAYRRVHRVAKEAMQQGIPYIYKKTDSALRGNLGAELAALSDAAEESVQFIPAFPKMHRVTRNGMHYIDGIPLGKSVFSQDPFEPISTSSVPELLAMQTALPVYLKKEGTEDPSERGICLYDAETEDDLKRIGEGLSLSGKNHFCAGCAGFAEVLAGVLSIPKDAAVQPVLPKKIAAFFGTIHPTSIAQMAYAEEMGYPRFHLTEAGRLQDGWCQSEAGERSADNWRDALKENRLVMIDANDAAGEEDLGNARVNPENRERIATHFGDIIAAFLQGGPEVLLFLTGGDTLVSAMKSLQVTALQPLAEILPGVVLAGFSLQDKMQYCIAKSGGFGQRDLMLRLLQELG